MTELQHVEREMLRVVIEVCKKLNIPYFLVCGSALGAVKYKGFIPWDDDVDIGIFREDYERFLREAQQLLPDHLFLQNYKTEPEYPHIFSKIRNSKTTYIEKSAKALPINHGVYIDVFPLDGYPSGEREQKRLERKKRIYRKLLSYKFIASRTLSERIVNNMLCILGVHKQTKRILKRYEKTVAAYSVDKSNVICNHGNWQGTLEYAPKWQYGKGRTATFEGLTVRIPENYDAYLTQKYGDWQSELPKEEQKGHHYYSIMDLNKPYTEYI